MATTAKGTFTLKQLRSDLQIRLGDLVPTNQFPPGILDAWINQACNTVYKTLSKAQPEQYRVLANSTTVSGVAWSINQATFTNIAQVETVMYHDDTTDAQVILVSPEEHARYQMNPLYTDPGVYYGYIYRSEGAGKKDTFLILNKSLSSGTLYFAYQRELQTMTADTHVMDIPNEYKDVVMDVAVSIARSQQIPALKQMSEQSVAKALVDEMQGIQSEQVRDIQEGEVE